MVKIVKPSVEIIYPPDRERAVELLKVVEGAGRVSHQSQDKITDDSYIEFIEKIIQKGHLSVIEHANCTVKFICDRGISHELVRHRIASYTQESTRYCAYGDEITVIEPPFKHMVDLIPWEAQMRDAEGRYKVILVYEPSQLARSVLPNSLKTEIWMTANLREWRSVIQIRGSKASHPQMRELMHMLLPQMQELFHPVFEDISWD